VPTHAPQDMLAKKNNKKGIILKSGKHAELRGGGKQNIELKDPSKGERVKQRQVFITIERGPSASPRGKGGRQEGRDILKYGTRSEGGLLF